MHNQRRSTANAINNPLLFFWVAACLVAMTFDSFAQESATRVPWNDSMFVGTPDPPLPYVLERAYPKQEFTGPVAMVPLPGTDRLVVVEQKGKVVSFSESHSDLQPSLMCDLQSILPAKKRIDVYSIVFHPNFLENRFAYVCYIVNPTSPKDPSGTHIARFRVTKDTEPTIDLTSEVTILTCGGGGHNGCTLLFGPDGYLYISIGDLEVPSPPDRLSTGQDITDLYASILRIDVDHPDADRAYSIPKDNPFVHLSGVKHEVYAFGFRNPWRMSFDRATGDLWVGDVGWEMYEMIYRVRSGGNYGWSIKEGPGDVNIHGKVGPTPILPADIVLTHADAASVTGGFVYRGTQRTGLQGKYIFGDWITKRFWSVGFDKENVALPIEIAASNVKPICFAIDHDGDLLVCDYSNDQQKAGLYRFKENPEAKQEPSQQKKQFPFALSRSGLWSDIKTRKPAPGVATYELNASMWADGAQAEYLLAIPGDGQATFYQDEQPTIDWFKTKVKYPPGTVLAKTYTIQVRPGDESSRIALETQIAHLNAVADWRYYSYRWNEDQSDATLVPADGAQRSVALDSDDPTQPNQKITWNFPSRSQCRTCHTTWAGESLGMLEAQLRKPNEKSDSWRTLIRQGFAALGKEKQPASDEWFTCMASAENSAASLNVRARSYLHVNCAHCHMFGAVGSSNLDMPFAKSLADTKSVDMPPMKGDYGFRDAKLIAPGSPAQSLILYRMAKSGTGRMPHIGAHSVDEKGVQLIHDWILQLPKDESIRGALDRVTAPVGQVNDQERMEACERLLADSTSGMFLVHAIRSGSVPKAFRDSIILRALESEDVIRDAIEPLARPDQRIERLGSGWSPATLLAVDGKSDTGKKLFERGVGQCNQCHRVDGQAKSTGPDLSKIGKKYPREKLLDQIIKPDESIEEAYQAIIVLTSDGSTTLGRVLQRTDEELKLQPGTGEPITIAIDSIEMEKRATQSLMPVELLSNLTKQQAADLLAYLEGLK